MSYTTCSFTPANLFNFFPLSFKVPYFILIQIIVKFVLNYKNNPAEKKQKLGVKFIVETANATPLLISFWRIRPQSFCPDFLFSAEYCPLAVFYCSPIARSSRFGWPVVVILRGETGRSCYWKRNIFYLFIFSKLNRKILNFLECLSTLSKKYII